MAFISYKQDNDPVLLYLNKNKELNLQDYFNSAARDDLETLVEYNKILEQRLSPEQKAKAEELFKDFLNDKYYHFDVGLDYINPDPVEEDIRLYHLAMLFALNQ